jgi:hypothetical protein
MGSGADAGTELLAGSHLKRTLPAEFCRRSATAALDDLSVEAVLEIILQTGELQQVKVIENVSGLLQCPREPA